MRPLTIGLSLSPTWLRGSSWRHADSRVEEMFDAAPMLEAARLAESARLDFLFKPDALVLDPAPLPTSPGFSAFDPVVLLSSLATATERIGLVPTVSSTYAHPYTAARQLQSLDRLSGGRVGWNVVTSLGGAENFGELAAPADVYADADDFVAVVEDLRQTYPADALVMDAARGRFADVTRLRIAEPRGRFRSTGPLTVPALSAQPWPLLHAGGSAASSTFAARHADAVFAMCATVEDAVALRARLDAAGGRGTRILPGLSLCLAKTRAEAEEMAASAGESPAHVRHWSVTGTPDDAVQTVLDWARTGAIDGFIALPTGSWRSLELFCTEVAPSLAAAGVLRSEYSGRTLREHLEENAR